MFKKPFSLISCMILLLFCLISIPVMGLTPPDLLLCADDFLWTTEYHEDGPEGPYIIWTTNFLYSSSLDIFLSLGEINYAKWRFPDGSWSEVYPDPASDGTIFNVYDSDGNLDIAFNEEFSIKALLNRTFCSNIAIYFFSILGMDNMEIIGNTCPDRVGTFISHSPPTLESFPCILDLSWSSDTIPTGDCQYEEWKTILSDNAEAKIISGPAGIYALSITEMDDPVWGMRKTYIAFLEEDMTYFIIETGDYTSFLTKIPKEMLIINILCTRDEPNLIDSFYEKLHPPGEKQTFGSVDGNMANFWFDYILMETGQTNQCKVMIGDETFILETPLKKGLKPDKVYYSEKKLPSYYNNNQFLNMGNIPLTEKNTVNPYFK